MLFEASMALVGLMFFLWGAAVWATYSEGETPIKRISHIGKEERKAA